MNVKVLLCGCALVMATTAYVCASDDLVEGNSMKRAKRAMFFSDGDALGVPDGWHGEVRPSTTTFPIALDVLKRLAKDCEEARQAVELGQAKLNGTLHSALNGTEIRVDHSTGSTRSLTPEEEASHEAVLGLIKQSEGEAQRLLAAIKGWHDLLEKLVGAHPASEAEGMSTSLAPIPPATMPDRPTKTPKPSISSYSE